jgi:type VI secretion system protein ImpH
VNRPLARLPVAQHLLAAPGEFDFVQAVDVAQQLARRAGRDVAGVGRGSDPRREALSLSAAFELSFRAQAIERVRLDEADKVWLLANFFGLGGPDGPLPEAYVDLIRAQLLAHDSAAADFLSVFQHRLLSFAYRAEDEFRAAGPFSAPDAGPLTLPLLGILGQPDLDPARAALLLANMPIVAQQRHSLHGFLQLIENQFGVQARGDEWAGCWVVLDDDLQTVLGPDGRNDVLGRGAVLGGRVWNGDGAVRVDLGELADGLYRALLPGGARHAELRVLCAWYLGPDLRCILRMTLAPDGAAPAALVDGCLLGHTSWLGDYTDERAVEFVLDAGGIVG